MYAQLLADIPAVNLQAAIARYLSESENRWFPAVGTLRRLAIESQQGVIPGWEWAWNEIIKAQRVWNQHDREACEKARAMLSPELMGFVTSILGGFYTLTNAEGEQLSIMQSHFRNAWTRQKEQAETLRKTPESLRPQLRLPDGIRSGIEDFGSMDRKGLEET